MSDNLTIEKLQKIIDDIDAARPILYYATSDQVVPGKALMVSETDWSHEAVILRPDDFEMFRRELAAHCQFIHLRDAPPKIPDTYEAAARRINRLFYQKLAEQEPDSPLLKTKRAKEALDS